MEARKKRALLARIEGQLAAMDRESSTDERRWRRIAWALGALGEMSMDVTEAEYLSRLRHHVDRIRGEAEAPAMPGVIRHRRTLIRSDCILWQLQLRRRQPVGRSEAA